MKIYPDPKRLSWDFLKVLICYLASAWFIGGAAFETLVEPANPMMTIAYAVGFLAAIYAANKFYSEWRDQSVGGN